MIEDQAARAVLAAWANPGANSAYHRKMQAELRRAWPVLAGALDRLAAGEDRQPADRVVPIRASRTQDVSKDA